LLLLLDGARSPLKPLHRLILAALGLALLGVSGLLTLPVVLDLVQGPFWFIAKVIVFVFVFVWVRATFPRFRYDQLMDFGWKFLLPLAALNIVATSLWIVWRAN
jgi:NADH:ubiquinone oxidoreductase subunit H